MNPRRLLPLIVALAMLVAGAAPRPAIAEDEIPRPLQGIDIAERPGAELPRDLRLRDQEGREVVLGQYLEGNKPLVLVLAYYQCPMLCSLVLNGVLKAMKDTPLTAGQDYRMLVVSFDPRDTAEVAQKKRAAYVGAYGRDVGERGFDFLVGDEATVRRLADTVGFGYRWDAQTEQYAHAAGAFVFTPEGRLSRTLYGIAFPEGTFRLALVEAGRGAIGTTLDRVLLFCFHYDPEAQGYVLASKRLMKAGGAVMVLALGMLLLRLWRGERARTREAS
jgi:protein SCO1/2